MFWNDKFHLSSCSQKIFQKYHKIQKPFLGFFFGYAIVVVIVILDASSAGGCVWTETTKG